MSRSITAALAILFLENLLSFSSRSSLNLFPTHLAALGASQTYIGFFMNIPAFMLIIFVFAFTKRTDKADKRMLLAVSFAIQIVGFILMALFNTNLIVLIFLQIIASAAYMLGFTILPNLVFEILPRNRRAGGIALFGISGVLSNPIGAILGEQILSHFGATFLPVSGAVFSLAALIVTRFVPFKKNEHHVVVHFRPLLRRVSVLTLALPSIALGGAWSTLATFIPNFSASRLGAPNLSLYFASHAIIAISLRIFFSRSLDRTSKHHILAAAFFLVSLAMGNMFLLKYIWQLPLSGLFYGAGHSVLYPVLAMVFVNSGSDRENYTLNNLFTAFYTCGNIFMPTLLGLLGDLTNDAYIFATMTIFSLFLAWYCFVNVKE